MTRQLVLLAPPRIALEATTCYDERIYFLAASARSFLSSSAEMVTVPAFGSGLQAAVFMTGSALGRVEMVTVLRSGSGTRFVRVVRLGLSTCHTISGRGRVLSRSFSVSVCRVQDRNLALVSGLRLGQRRVS